MCMYVCLFTYECHCVRYNSLMQINKCRALNAHVMQMWVDSVATALKNKISFKIKK